LGNETFVLVDDRSNLAERRGHGVWVDDARRQVAVVLFETVDEQSMSSCLILGSSGEYGSGLEW